MPCQKSTTDVQGDSTVQLITHVFKNQDQMSMMEKEKEHKNTNCFRNNLPIKANNNSACNEMQIGRYVI
jgi:hypothetical protein